MSSYADFRRTAEEDGRSTLAFTLFYWEKDWLHRYRHLDQRTSLADAITRDGLGLEVDLKKLPSVSLKVPKSVFYIPVGERIQ